MASSRVADIGHESSGNRVERNDIMSSEAKVFSICSLLIGESRDPWNRNLFLKVSEPKD
jgi:hypothetical protein